MVVNRKVFFFFMGQCSITGAKELANPKSSSPDWLRHNHGAL
jgi:hypothetical protein